MEGKALESSIDSAGCLQKSDNWRVAFGSLKSSNNFYNLYLSFLRLPVQSIKILEGIISLKKRFSCDLNELLERQLAVHVLVHLPEDLVRSLFWRGLVFGHLQHRTNLKLCHVNFADFNGQPFGLMWKRQIHKFMNDIRYVSFVSALTWKISGCIS